MMARGYRIAYPLLSPEEVLFLDDYGCYKGARKAADEYLSENDIRVRWFELTSMSVWRSNLEPSTAICTVYCVPK